MQCIRTSCGASRTRVTTSCSFRVCALIWIIQITTIFTELSISQQRRKGEGISTTNISSMQSQLCRLRQISDMEYRSERRFRTRFNPRLHPLAPRLKHLWKNPQACQHTKVQTSSPLEHGCPQHREDQDVENTTAQDVYRYFFTHSNPQWILSAWLFWT